MTNIEKNRLIEKFMGWELKFITDYDLNQWCFVNKHTGKTISGMYNNSELPYCTDWNWLMEALYSFDNLDVSLLPAKYCEICDQIDHAVTLYNIDDAVNALCEGIECGIIGQLDGTERPFIQKNGRMLRAEFPEIYVLYFQGTKDEDYLQNVINTIPNEYLVYL